MVASARSVITVDGPAGSGKSTLARMLAARLGFKHLNSGMAYRAVALLLQQGGIECTGANRIPKELRIARQLAKHSIEILDSKLFEEGDGGTKEGTAIRIDGTVCGSELFSPETGSLASKLSAMHAVRDFLLPVQRRAFQGKSIVAEGRDMGTVVFPDAQLKFYIEADQKVRTARRQAQLVEQGITLTAEEVSRELQERDRRDSERAISPLIPALDAVIIDNSSIGLTEILENMYNSALSRGLVAK